MPYLLMLKSFAFKLPNITLALAIALTGLSIWMIFFWVPTEVNQGAIQRIVYLHVPVAWGSMVAIIAVAAASVLYLRTNKERWDRLAASIAEVGVVAGGLMLLSGMIWARPVWGVWWTGEAKLTTALVLFFLYIGYLMFRSYFPPGKQRQRIAAVIALIGAVDTPIIYFAAQIWERTHPPAVIGPVATDQTGFAAEFGITLLVSTLAVTFLLVRLIYDRYKVRQVEDGVYRISAHVAEVEGSRA